MPAERYWEIVAVSPARARSKSLAARSRAAGGRAVGFEPGWEVGGGSERDAGADGGEVMEVVAASCA